MQRRIYGHATAVEIRPLNEEKAVQAAVDLMGELFVFSVAVADLFFEGMRQRDEELAQEVELLKQKLAEIEKMANARGLAGVFNFRQAQAEEARPTPAA
ncbi:hypothetical protein SASPL_146210 [Salvia splendens]|uniref:Uncharacterized protein n=1 Tax=Salvia splendens TaxID=180675 RepID=A0A8X8Z5D0_SALSN|nr:hypothetical protein SASPL_146210 [Salvia splendens]